MQDFIDEIVVDGIRNGDTTAFKLLFDTYYISLCDYAMSIVRHGQVAEDLVQEVYANIWNIKDDWTPNHTVKSYLFRAVRNQALNYLKHEKLEKKWAERVQQNGQADQVFDPEEHDNSEIEKVIYSAIDDLPPQKTHRICTQPLLSVNLS